MYYCQLLTNLFHANQTPLEEYFMITSLKYEYDKNLTPVIDSFVTARALSVAITRQLCPDAYVFGGVGGSLCERG